MTVCPRSALNLIARFSSLLTIQMHLTCDYTSPEVVVRENQIWQTPDGEAAPQVLLRPLGRMDGGRESQRPQSEFLREACAEPEQALLRREKLLP